MTTAMLKAGAIVLLAISSSVIAGCAGPAASSCARPGDYAANYESAPLSALYPGNYPASAASAIGSGVSDRAGCP